MTNMHLLGFLDVINAWAQAAITTLGYPGLGLVMFLENVLPVIPSEAVLPLAGSLTLNGRFTLFGISLVGALGSLIGAIIYYGLGRWLGESRVRYLMDRYGRWLALSSADLDRAISWFDRYGEQAIFFGCMVPMVRSLISIPAGLAGMNLPRFIMYTALGSALWNLILAWAGRLLGQNWSSVSTWIGRYEHMIMGLVAIAVILFIAWRLLNAHKISAKTTAER